MRNLTLQSEHAHRCAHFGTVREREVVLHYGSVAVETERLQRQVALVDFSFRDRLCLLGPDRVRFLNGQVTNDVKALVSGQGCYAALTTGKGRMVSDLNIHVLSEELLLDCEPGLGGPVAARLEHHLVADDVQIVDASPHYALFGLLGPEAVDTLAGLLPARPDGPWRQVHWNEADCGTIYLIQMERYGEIGFDLFVPITGAAAWWRRLEAAVLARGGGLAGWDALENIRVERGIPRFGADLDEHTLPPEAGLEAKAISYSKGCYAGQEVIARIRTYGHVNRKLCRLRGPADAQVPWQPGDKLLQGDREIGHVTSIGVSSALRSNIALGYVRRGTDSPGASLQVLTSAGPFPVVLL